MRPGTVRHSGLTSIPAAAVAEYTGGSVECLVQAHALDAGPFGSTTAARQALVDTLRRQVESMRRNPEAALDNCSCTLRHAFDCPQLAAALVSSGLLDSMLAAAQARHTTAGRAAREMVARLPDQGLAVLIGLQVGARHTGQTAGSCAATQEAAQQCEAAAASLEAALNALTDRPVAQRAQLYPSKLKPLAQAVAAALETFWEAQELHQRGRRRRPKRWAAAGQLALRSMPRCLVLRHRLLACRLASKPPPRVQGAGGGTAAEKAKKAAAAAEQQQQA
ncbi:hypothetical protein C2E21_3582 [Chlorella sorokiniana]|uniref:Uncharacterized protein n=1 Tax=Chlorella sorokiniana TaxID=3076 RepID=A0A2P6TU15_CHLSO|nr:hypothetical protein C2E21_3582 [Chlorella sorokiniana]|eukprot:PRW57565.1 hypothetical protein C2E21_3582 [Chlorella sorokiniana]